MVLDLEVKTYKDSSINTPAIHFTPALGYLCHEVKICLWTEFLVSLLCLNRLFSSDGSGHSYDLSSLALPSSNWVVLPQTGYKDQRYYINVCKSLVPQSGESKLPSLYEMVRLAKLGFLSQVYFYTRWRTN